MSCQKSHSLATASTPLQDSKTCLINPLATNATIEILALKNKTKLLLDYALLTHKTLAIVTQ